MTKQEEIREVIDAYTDDRCLYLGKDCEWCSKEGYYCASDNDAFTCLMKRLGEMGVVIKVDRELLPPELRNLEYHENGVKLYDIVAVEPLINKH